MSKQFCNICFIKYLPFLYIFHLIVWPSFGTTPAWANYVLIHYKMLNGLYFNIWNDHVFLGISQQGQITYYNTLQTALK